MDNKANIKAAEKRVEEMNRLTQGYLEQGNRFLRQQNGNRPPPKHNNPRFENVAPPVVPLPPKKEPSAVPTEKGTNFLSDNALLLVLAAVLIKENADIKLILALLYILM